MVQVVTPTNLGAEFDVGILVANKISIRRATDLLAGVVALAVGANYPALANDIDAATPAYVQAALVAIRITAAMYPGSVANDTGATTPAYVAAAIAAAASVQVSPGLSVATPAALRVLYAAAAPVALRAVVFVESTQGFFRWTGTAGSVGEDNTGTVIVDTTGALRRWERIYDGYCDPFWFEAACNGIADDIIPLEKCRDVIQNPAYKKPRAMRIWLHLISRTFVITPTVLNNIHVYGDGTGLVDSRITAGAVGFIGSVAVFVAGQTIGSLNGIVDFGLHDFAIVRQEGSACLAGLQIGEGDKQLVPLQRNSVSGINITGFHINYIVMNTTYLKFDRCSSWPISGDVDQQVGVFVTLVGDGFTGDMEFDSCQIVGIEGVGKGVKISHNEPLVLPNGQMAAVHFNRCQIVGGGVPYVEIATTSSGAIDDLWFTNTQFDGAATDPGDLVHISAANGSVVEGAIFNACKFAGVRAGSFALHVDKAGTGLVNGLNVANNRFYVCSTQAIHIDGAQGTVFCDNGFFQCASVDSVAFFDNGSAVVMDNILSNLGETTVHFIQFGAGMSVRSMEFGNVASAADCTGLVTLDSRPLYSNMLTRNLHITDRGLGVGIDPSFPIDVELALFFVGVAKFGAALPLYIMQSPPTIGFNAYYNAGYKYGRGSVVEFCQAQQFDTATGDMSWFVSTTGGVADNPATMVERLQLKQTGQLRLMPLGADPAGLEDGDMWYNSATGKFRGRAAGVSVDLN